MLKRIQQQINKMSDDEILLKLHSYKKDDDQEIVEFANRVTNIPEINKELYFAILCCLKNYNISHFETQIKKVHLALTNIIKQSVDDKNINKEAIQYKNELEEFKNTLPKQYLYSHIPIMLKNKQTMASWTLKTSQLINTLISTQG
jgi:hypothetical protein